MDKEKLSTSADLLRLSTLGISFVLCTFAGLGLGLLIHKYLHWGNWVIMAGFGFGVIASYVVLYESFKALNQDQKKPPSP